MGFLNCTKMHWRTLKGSMPCAQPGATDGCWPSLERRRAIWNERKREKKRGTASAEFENRVNGASYGAYTVVSAHVKIGARTVAAHAVELVHSRHSRELESWQIACQGIENIRVVWFSRIVRDKLGNSLLLRSFSLNMRKCDRKSRVLQLAIIYF